MLAHLYSKMHSPAHNETLGQLTKRMSMTRWTLAFFITSAMPSEVKSDHKEEDDFASQECLYELVERAPAAKTILEEMQ